MTTKTFIDTNILIYCYVTDDLFKEEIAQNIMSKDFNVVPLIISAQVLNEFTKVLFRKNIPINEVHCFLNELVRSFIVTPISSNTTFLALTLCEKYKFSWWDSLVLASALENDCSILYTEDMQNKQIIEGTLQIVNPFIILD
jgi:predicted nucleic acid-binding protein